MPKNKSEADPLGLVGISEGALKGGDKPPKKAKSVLENVSRFRFGTQNKSEADP